MRAFRHRRELQLITLCRTGARALLASDNWDLSINFRAVYCQARLAKQGFLIREMTGLLDSRYELRIGERTTRFTYSPLFTFSGVFGGSMAEALA